MRVPRCIHPLGLRASVLITSLLLANAPSAQAQEVTNDARVHFAAGVNLLRDPGKPRYEEAYHEFKAAYELAPVVQILGNLGLCAMMLERDSEAIDAYEKYLKGMIDLEPNERAQIERDVMTLKVGMARVTLSSNLKGVTVIDQRITSEGVPVTNVYGPLDSPITIGIRRGHHVMTARAPNRPELIWDVDAPAGNVPPHTFEFPVDTSPTPSSVRQPSVEPPAERPIPPSFWYGLGATGVLAAATAVTGIVTLNVNSTFSAANDGRTPERADSLRSDGQALNTATDVLLATTVVGAAVTTFIYLTRPEKRVPHPNSERPLGWSSFRLGGSW